MENRIPPLIIVVGQSNFSAKEEISEQKDLDGKPSMVQYVRYLGGSVTGLDAYYSEIVWETIGSPFPYTISLPDKNGMPAIPVDEFIVTPNPMTNGISFRLNSINPIDAVTIYNRAGEKINYIVGDSHACHLRWSGKSLSGIKTPPGIYYYRIGSNGRQAVGQFVKVD